MKTILQKSILIVMIAFFSFWQMCFAQTEVDTLNSIQLESDSMGAIIEPYYTDFAYKQWVEKEVETIYNKPKSNRVTINVGGQLDLPNYGIYGYGKGRVGRYVFSSLYVMSPNSAYNIQEVHLIFGFGNADDPYKDKPRVSTEANRVEEVLKKSGGRDVYITAQNVTKETVQYNSGYGSSNNNIRGDATTKSTTTSTTTENVTTKTKSYVNLYVPSHTIAGLSAGAYHWLRPSKEVGNINVVGFSFGLNASITKKSKYKIHWKERINNVQIISLGNYLVTPTDEIKKTGTKTRRSNTAIDVGMEFLFAPMVQIDSTQSLVYSHQEQKYNMENIQKKHGGFRIRMEIRQGPISMRYDLGFRPGTKFMIGGEKGEDNFFTRNMRGGYILFGLGYGIGLL